MTPASGRRTNSRCRRSRHVRSIMQRRRAYQRTRLASVRDAAHNGNGRADRTGLDRVDRKATYSRAMDVPEGALLAVKDLPVELVSFLIHSKHNTTRTHTHSTCIRSHSANVVVLPLKPLLAHTKILIDDRAASEPVTHNRLIIMGNGSRVPWFIMLDSSSTWRFRYILHNTLNACSNIGQWITSHNPWPLWSIRFSSTSYDLMTYCLGVV